MTPPTRTASEIADALLARDPPPPLVPARVFDPALAAEIEAADAPALVKAGLHLLNDDLGAAHRLAQAHEGDPLADHWHAVIHRREGDYDNARYWLRRLAGRPSVTAFYGPDPAAPGAFVEQCRRIGHGRDAGAEGRQRGEMAALLARAQAGLP
jgi:hypothetical protein